MVWSVRASLKYCPVRQTCGYLRGNIYVRDTVNFRIVGHFKYGVLRQPHTKKNSNLGVLFKNQSCRIINDQVCFACWYVSARNKADVCTSIATYRQSMLIVAVIYQRYGRLMFQTEALYHYFISKENNGSLRLNVSRCKMMWLHFYDFSKSKQFYCKKKEGTRRGKCVVFSLDDNSDHWNRLYDMT